MYADMETLHSPRLSPSRSDLEASLPTDSVRGELLYKPSSGVTISSFTLMHGGMHYWMLVLVYSKCCPHAEVAIHQSTSSSELLEYQSECMRYPN